MSTSTPWIKASASGGGNQCVEMRRNGTWMEVRDSKDPEGPMLRFRAAELVAWIDVAKKGEFDHMVA